VEEIFVEESFLEGGLVEEPGFSRASAAEIEKGFSP
jgi:hypothetical protein